MKGKPSIVFFDMDHTVREFADNWGWENIETDWRNVIERDDIEIVDISVPQDLHHEIAIAAAKAGKHIFCEKPIALTVAQAKEMYEVAEAAGIVHYLNHNPTRWTAWCWTLAGPMM